MENLVAKIKNCNLNDDDKYLRNFISSIATRDFRKTMLENYKQGLDNITFLKYTNHDKLIVGVESFLIKDLATSPIFWEILTEVFPDFFIGLTNTGSTYYINIHWNIN